MDVHSHFSISIFCISVSRIVLTFRGVERKRILRVTACRETLSKCVIISSRTSPEFLRFDHVTGKRSSLSPSGHGDVTILGFLDPSCWWRDEALSTKWIFPAILASRRVCAFDKIEFGTIASETNSKNSWQFRWSGINRSVKLWKMFSRVCYRVENNQESGAIKDNWGLFSSLLWQV